MEENAEIHKGRQRQYSRPVFISGSIGLPKVHETEAPEKKQRGQLANGQAWSKRLPPGDEIRKVSSVDADGASYLRDDEDFPDLKTAGPFGNQ